MDTLLLTTNRCRAARGMAHSKEPRRATPCRCQRSRCRCRRLMVWLLVLEESMVEERCSRTPNQGAVLAAKKRPAAAFSSHSVQCHLPRLQDVHLLPAGPLQETSLSPSAGARMRRSSSSWPNLAAMQCHVPHSRAPMQRFVNVLSIMSCAPLSPSPILLMHALSYVRR